MHDVVYHTGEEPGMPAGGSDKTPVAAPEEHHHWRIAQLLVVVPKAVIVLLAFSIMILVSELFVGNILQSHLAKEALGTLTDASLRIDQETLSAETMLTLIAQNVQTMLASNMSQEEVLAYLREMTEYMQTDDKMRRFNYEGVYGSFDIFGGASLDGVAGREIPEGFDPKTRPWYIAAEEAGGNVVLTSPYQTVNEGYNVITYAKRLIDPAGTPQAVLCMDIPMESISKHVADIQITPDAYGLLLDASMHILAHPNPDMLGYRVDEVNTIFSDVIQDIESGVDFVEKEGVNFRGETSIFYTAHICNDWVVTIVVPKDEYFGEVTNMRFTIGAIGIAMALILITIMVSMDMAKIRAEEREREAEIQMHAASAADELKSQFLANMSHEIRTPMNAILGMSELLLQDSMSRRQRQYAEDIRSSAEALLETINDILDVSKMQVGRFTLVPVHYDFYALIDAVSSTAQFLTIDKEITFRLSMQEETPACLYGDEVRLRQVLTNLIGNAIKFTDSGYVELAVSSTDDTVTLVVRDTGIGIAQEEIPGLFDPFAQADVVRNRNTRGSGLGLAITKSIVDMMEGQITVESVYGKGSTFRVDIPLVPGDFSLIYREDGEDIAVYIPDARILVVDDIQVNLSVASGLLRLTYAQVDTATSGEEAIEKVRQASYDIIFMDHRMPSMSGTDATVIMRDMGCQTPIIALTASAVVGAREKMLESGMDDFLPKPIIKADLKRMLRKWIPQEKQLVPPMEDRLGDVQAGEEYWAFWDSVADIEGLSMAEGLDRVENQRDVYMQTLRLMQAEIEKCIRNLDAFLAAGDMPSFRIEVHGIKGSLANVGAKELAEMAYALEKASEAGDTGYCAAYLGHLRKGLQALQAGLQEAFALIAQDEGPVEILPEMPSIFARLMQAFDTFDLVMINQEVDKLNALGLQGRSKEEVERIKDAVMMMEYDEAKTRIVALLDNAYDLGL